MKIRIIITLLSLFVIGHEVVFSQFDLQIASSSITCNGLCDGNATVSLISTLTCGNGPYQYQIIGPSTATSPVTSATSYTFTNLCAGSYSVNVLISGNVCTSGSFNIIQPPSLYTSISTSLPLCAGNDGSALITVNGGTPGSCFNNCRGYNVLWTGPGGIGGGSLNACPKEIVTCSQSSATNTYSLTNLSPGTYNVTIEDNNNCPVSASFTITPPPPPITVSGLVANNAIDITVTGGTPGYTYSWSNGATTEDLSNLSPGTYSVVVTDLNGCTVTASYTVQNQNPVLSVNLAISNILCFGDQNGMINLTVAGGNAPYNVSWSGPVSGNPAGNEILNSGGSYNISNIPAGIYTVTVTDSNGNSTNISATITQPQSPLTLSTMTTNNLCFGAQTGAIDLTVSGGTGIYAYSWNTGAITQDITGLAAGLYMVTLIDANGCTATTVATITQPQSPLTLTTTQVNVLCNGANTGSINLTPTGGTAPYVYLWSNGSTVQDPQNLVAGTYSVVVTDENGCTAFASVIITQPANPLSASYVQTNVTCNGLSNGSINVTVTGGAQPYTYAWSHGPTTEDLTGLSAGTYNLTITYAQQCTSSLSVTITEPPALSLSTNESNVSCNSGGNGSIDLTVSGGTAGYTYLWSNGSTLQDPQNLVAGTYSVTVTDANNCIAQASVTITEPLPISLTGSVNANAIDITVSGGTPPYSFSWIGGGWFGSNSEDISDLAHGTYTVTVTDANGCTSTESFTVDNVGLEQQHSIELQVFPNPAQGVVTIHSSSSGIGNTYRMLDCYGRNVAEGKLQTAETTFSIQALANGVYHLQLGANTVSFVVSH